MSSHQLIAGNSPTGYKTLRRNEYASEGELETRIKNLDQPRA